MSTTRLLLIALGIVAGAFVVTWLVFAFWRVRSEMRRRAAGDAPLTARRSVIWRDPGPAESLDLAAGPGGRDGAPVAAVQLRRRARHRQLSLRVRARRARTCVAGEVGRRGAHRSIRHSPGVGRRLFRRSELLRALRTHRGRSTLQRAGECIAEDGAFRDARFELDEPGVVKHFDEHSWAWNENPFVGTRELNGLKIVMMLLSNWDNKDVRDVARGSNTAIFEYQMDRDVREARYLIIDWGAALGTWGSNVLSRGRWDSPGVRRTERSVRARRGRRSGAVGLQGSAHG